MENSEIQKLKRTLEYLESKQRELKKYNETEDSRSIESIIKYLKKEMLDQFNLVLYDEYIKEDIRDTDIFIRRVRHILERNL